MKKLNAISFLFLLCCVMLSCSKENLSEDVTSSNDLSAEERALCAFGDHALPNNVSSNWDDFFSLVDGAIQMGDAEFSCGPVWEICYTVNGVQTCVTPENFAPVFEECAIVSFIVKLQCMWCVGTFKMPESCPIPACEDFGNTWQDLFYETNICSGNINCCYKPIRPCEWLSTSYIPGLPSVNQGGFCVDVVMTWQNGQQCEFNVCLPQLNCLTPIPREEKMKALHGI